MLSFHNVIRLSLLCMLATAAGCAEATTPENVGGETHFLHACDGTDSCGVGLDCVCGVCTATCLTDNSCKDQSTLATCEAAGTPNGACDNPQASPVCDVKCTLDADCTTLGTTYTCESGSCRKLETGSCVAGGVIYADGDRYSPDACNTCTCNGGSFSCTGVVCMDGGMDSGAEAGIDGSIEAGEDVVVLAEPSCTNDDDAGTSALEPSPPRSFDCAELDSVTLLPGAQVLGTAWGVGDLVLGPDDAYWSDSSGTPYLQRVPKGSETALSLPPIGNSQWDTTSALSVDGCRIYWGNGSDGRSVWIGSALTASGERTTLSMVPAGNASAVHVDGPFLYFATSGAVNELFRVGRGGGTTVKLAEGVSRLGSALTTTQGNLYWITGDENPQTAQEAINVLPTDLSAPARTFASSLANPTSLLADATHLYVANYGTEDALRNRNGDGSLVRYEIATATPTTMAPLALGPEAELTQDAQHLYWFAGARGQVALMRIAKQGAAVAEPVFQNLGLSRHLVVDETHFYWVATCGDGGTGEYVVRVPKP